MPLDGFTLHIGKNVLASSKSSEQVANSIINLTCQPKTKSHGVNVSTIISRTDETKLYKKVK